MLRALADDAGCDQADVVRGDVRRRYEERFGRQVVPPPAEAAR